MKYNFLSKPAKFIMKRKKKFFAIEWWKRHSNIWMRCNYFGQCKRILNEIQFVLACGNYIYIFIQCFVIISYSIVRLVCLPRVIVHFSLCINTQLIYFCKNWFVASECAKETKNGRKKYMVSHICRPREIIGFVF